MCTAGSNVPWVMLGQARWDNLGFNRTEQGIEGGTMNELEQVLIGDSAASPPAVILEGLDAALAHLAQKGAPRTIYEELWHITFWQKMTLDWVNGIQTAYPVHASAGFPTEGSEEHTSELQSLRHLVCR